VIPPDTSVADMVYAQAPDLWHLPADVWKDVHDRVDGSGVTVAVLDTGYTKHDFGPDPIASRSFINGESARDGNGHGTHCAGTVLGQFVGCAPGANLIVGKVLSNRGSGASGGIAAGIRWATEQGADIISMSLGGGSSYGPTNEAIDAAFAAGCIVNAAAGNSGYNGSNTIGWPAKYTGCLCTGAYRSDGRIANFSSGGRQIDWACPGQDIVSFSNSGSGFRSMSGTSMATPFGSGVLALIVELMRREGQANWTAIEAVREFFRLNMRDTGQPGFDVRFGFGVPVVGEIMATLIDDSLTFA
jgi:subtilisin family serine protease